jgi:hypothetical protein
MIFSWAVNWACDDFQLGGQLGGLQIFDIPGVGTQLGGLHISIGQVNLPNERPILAQTIGRNLRTIPYCAL